MMVAIPFPFAIEGVEKKVFPKDLVKHLRCVRQFCHFPTYLCIESVKECGGLQECFYLFRLNIDDLIDEVVYGFLTCLVQYTTYTGDDLFPFRGQPTKLQASNPSFHMLRTFLDLTSGHFYTKDFREKSFCFFIAKFQVLGRNLHHLTPHF